MKKRSSLLLFYLIFAIFFTFAGVVSGFALMSEFFSGQKLKKEGVPVEATISNIESISTRSSKGKRTVRHYVYVDYQVDGETYEKQINQYDSSMYIGKKLTLYYFDDYGPHSAEYVNTTFNVILAVVFGGIFTTVGVVFIIKSVTLVLRKRLLKTGTPVYADVTYCGFGSIRINNRRTYKVECEWIDESGISHTYSADGISYNPQSEIDSGKVEVYVDNNDYNKYYVNL